MQEAQSWATNSSSLYVATFTRKRGKENERLL